MTAISGFEQLKPQDPFIYNEIFEENVYDIREEDVKGKVVLDIGANLGFVSLLCERYGASHIVAVEGQPNTFQHLLQNTKGKDRIALLGLLAYSKTGEKLKINDAAGGSSIYAADATVEVETISLQDLVNSVETMYDPQSDMVLKLDVEGSEYDIILDAPQEVFKKFSTIYLEIHSELHPDPARRGFDTLLAYLDNLGFKVTYKKSLIIYQLDGSTVISPVCNFKLTRQASKVVVEGSHKVLCCIPTKGRYFDTLPLTLQSVIFQTKRPDALMIYDDNPVAERKDLRTVDVYRRLFGLMDSKGIKWEVIFGDGHGQQHGHQAANKKGFEFVWRLDDDEIAEPNVLERLMAQMKPGVGAVAGTVLDSGDQPGGTGKLKDIYSTPNIQWARGEGIVEVEHLYSSFLYRAGIQDYDLILSPPGHREETIFTHGLFRKGYKLLVDRSVLTHHFRNPAGGIRSNTDRGMFEHDEAIFVERMKSWGYAIILLDSGLGDHYCFLNILPDLKKKYKYIILGCCYPEVFKDDPDLVLTSVAAMGLRRGADNVYKWMLEHDWKKSIVEAYRGMYLCE